MISLSRLLTFATVLSFCCAELRAATCRLSVAGLNRERLVPGWAQLAQECGWEGLCWHSPRWGNWGADSNYGRRIDGDQFQGWHPEDGHWQWNSCTINYPCSTCDNCNHPRGLCWHQKSEQWGYAWENVHGSKHVDIWVNCPEDTNGDGQCDRGGCKDVWSYGEWDNFVRLYELDPGWPPWCGEDDYVDTLYFPPTSVTLVCEPFYCHAAGTGWAARTSSSFTHAEMAMVVNFGTYVDDPYCEYQRYFNPRYNCW